jgi:nitric oxide reductase large subunit
MSKPYVPGEDDIEPEIPVTTKAQRVHKTHFVADIKTDEEFPVSKMITIGVLVVAVIAVVTYLIFALSGMSVGFFGQSSLDTEEERALFELSQIQKAQERAKRDIMHYMNFEQLAVAGYLLEIEIESVEATRLITPNAIFELTKAQPENNYLIYADTRNGTESWTIDQDSKDVLKTYGGG